MFGHKVQNKSRSKKDEGFTIGNMVVGQVAYAPADAMRVDTRNTWWLNPNSPAKGRPSNINQLQVKLEKDGFHVKVPVGFHWIVRQHADRISFAATEYVEVANLLLV